MLDEYKLLYKQSADLIPGWENMSKNELCRAYVAAAGNKELQNSYLSAVMYRYWNLISKYYYMSANCATVEDCYEWLADSVMCCLNLASWENESSSIYKDPNGPDKVINRCMKCARLTYYQFINRKKRKNNFGMVSLDELSELFGKGVAEPTDTEQEFDVSSVMIDNFITTMFSRKDYFVAVLVDCIISSNCFDITIDPQQGPMYEFNLRKLVRTMTTLDDGYILYFSRKYNIPYDLAAHGISYVQNVPSGNMRKKIQTQFELLKHSDLINGLGGDYTDVN